MVLVTGFASNAGNIERGLEWLPQVRRFARVVTFDKRGVGLSERAVGIADLETRMYDVRSVMDAVGLERAHLHGVSEGGPMSILFAATYPERVQSLTLRSTFARFVRSDDHPWMPTVSEREATRFVEEHWGEGLVVGSFFAEEELTGGLRARLAEAEMQGASPRAIAQLMEMNMSIDVRSILPSINVPTLVVHFTGDQRVPVECGRYLAAHIQRARLVELEGGAHRTLQPERPRWMDAFEELVTGHRAAPDPDRVLATVLFTDIVSSTEMAAERGDAAGRVILDSHDAAVRREVDTHRGILVKSMGDGMLARFDGPGARWPAPVRSLPTSLV